MVRIVGGNKKNHRLASLDGHHLRPTSDRVRESIFDILQHAIYLPDIIPEATVVDLFAGTGALGLEALSRGAKHLTAVEKDPTACRIFESNVNTLNYKKSVTLLRRDATQLPRAKEPYDLIFIDPPYHLGLITPALISLQNNNWLNNSSTLVLETSSKQSINLPAAFNLLCHRTYGSTSIRVLSVNTDL